MAATPDVPTDAAPDTDGIVVPDPRKKPTLTIPEAGRLLGYAPRTSYDAVDRGEIPVLDDGRTRNRKVPTALLLKRLGLNAQ